METNNEKIKREEVKVGDIYFVNQKINKKDENNVNLYLIVDKSDRKIFAHPINVDKNISDESSTFIYNCGENNDSLLVENNIVKSLGVNNILKYYDKVSFGDLKNVINKNIEIMYYNRPIVWNSDFFSRFSLKYEDEFLPGKDSMIFYDNNFYYILYESFSSLNGILLDKNFSNNKCELIFDKERYYTDFKEYRINKENMADIGLVHNYEEYIGDFILDEKKKYLKREKREKYLNGYNNEKGFQRKRNSKVSSQFV